MSARKYFDIGEWQAWGGLQEANRLHFHPHGLALEVTHVTDWDDPGPAMLARIEALAEILTDVIGVGPPLPDHPSLALHYARKILARQYPVGTRFLSGIWDSRDDPEGIVFGDWPEECVQKAQNVLAERERHFMARSAMFGVPVGAGISPIDPDVEPFSYVWQPPEGDGK